MIPPPSNDDAAEKAANTTAAALGDSPVVTMSLSDPDALDNVKRRTSSETARRGRNTLRIPLSQTARVSSGIAIPV